MGGPLSTARPTRIETPACYGSTEGPGSGGGMSRRRGPIMREIEAEIARTQAATHGSECFPISTMFSRQTASAVSRSDRQFDDAIL